MTTTTRPLPPPVLACFLYAVRVCVPPKRWALLALPAIGSVLFGLLANVVEDATTEEAFATVCQGIFALVVPFATLVVGDAVLGAERRSGALALTWLSPTPFGVIIGARWAAGWLLAVVALAPGMVLAAVIAGLPAAIGPLLVATASSAAAYVALFVLLGAAFQRAALWSLAVVFLGERVLGAALTGVAQLSPGWLGRSVYGGLGPGADELVREGMPSGWGAVVRLALLTGVCLLLATRRLRKLKLTGASD